MHLSGLANRPYHAVCVAFTLQYHYRERAVEEAAQVQQPVYAMIHRQLSYETALFHVPLCAADAARSAHNIALWKSYLPTTCVRTMVRMGWDYTT